MGFKWNSFVALLSLLSLAASEKHGIPGVDHYWVPRDLNNTVLAMFRFNEAMSRCWFEGGHLAVVNSEADAQAIQAIMLENDITGFAFIGFSDLLKEGIFTTLDDVPLQKAGYTAWASGFPNGGTSSNCGAINAKAELADVGCTQILPLICEKDVWTSYKLVAGMGYYKLHTQELTWGKALRQCHEEGATLAVINSDEEAAVIAGLFEGGSASLAHVGLQDEYREAFYFTLQGVKIENTGYNKWTTMEPVKNSLINYVAVDNEGLYHMVNGTYQLPYICEHAL